MAPAALCRSRAAFTPDFTPPLVAAMTLMRSHRCYEFASVLASWLLGWSTLAEASTSPGHDMQDIHPPLVPESQELQAFEGEPEFERCREFVARFIADDHVSPLGLTATMSAKWGAVIRLAFEVAPSEAEESVSPMTLICWKRPGTLTIESFIDATGGSGSR